MPDEPTVAAVRVFVPEASHSTRQRQLQVVLSLLRDQLRVRGLTIVAGVQGIGHGGAAPIATVGDVPERDQNPPMIIEFFDEPAAADAARRMLRDMLPECPTVCWQASTDSAVLAKASQPTAEVQQRRAPTDQAGGGGDETECGGSPASQDAPAGTVIAEQKKDGTFRPPQWMDAMLSDLFREEHANLLVDREDNAAAILQRIALAPQCEQMWEDIRSGRGFYRGDGPIPQILDPKVRSELKKDETIRAYVEKLEGWLARLPDPVPLIRAYGFAHVAAEAAQIADLPIGSPSAETLAAGGVLPVDSSISTIREAKRWMRSRVEARVGPQRGPVLHCPTERAREECLVFFVQGILMREVGAVHQPTIAALASAALGTRVNMWKLRIILDRLKKRQGRVRIA